MELQDSLTLERYKVAIDRQRYFTSVARDAFATFARFVAGIAAVVVTLMSARESFGLDKALMPALLGLLAYVLAFLGIVGVTQIAIALVRWHHASVVAAGIDPDTPKPHPTWWMSETVYALVIVASVVIGWRVLEELARAFPSTG